MTAAETLHDVLRDMDRANADPDSDAYCVLYPWIQRLRSAQRSDAKLDKAPVRPGRWARAKWYPGVKCHLCGGVIKRGQESGDHVIPRSKGGPDHPSNYAMSHATCNNKRGNYPIGDKPSRLWNGRTGRKVFKP